jgi:hypothetical protein
MSDTDTHFKFLQSKLEEDRNIKKHLEKSIENCLSLKAAVAFFNIRANYFSKCNLGEVLSRKDSFFCVDIHDPTNLDELKNFYSDESEPKPNFFLFIGGKPLAEISKICESPGSKKRGKERTQDFDWQLLHTKLLLFTFNDDRAEIWIGSQNFTQAAIEGTKNFESTVVIQTSVKNIEYTNVKSYLEFLRNKCVEFNRQHIDCYHRIQNWLKEAESNSNPKHDHTKELKILCTDVRDVTGAIGVLSFYDKDILKQKKDTDKFELSKIVTQHGDKITIIAEDSQGIFIGNSMVEVSISSDIPTVASAEKEGDREFVTTNYNGTLRELNKLSGYIVRFSGIYPFYFKLSEDDERKRKEAELFWNLVEGGRFIYFRVKMIDEDGLLGKINRQPSRLFHQQNSKEQHEHYLKYYQHRLHNNSFIELEPSIVEYQEPIVVKKVIKKNKKLRSSK